MTVDTAQKSLGREQVEAYHEQGYLIVREVFAPAEIAALEAESRTLFDRQELIDATNLRCRWADHVESGECLFDCFDPVIDIGPVCRYFARDERILSLLRTLYDDEAFLLKDKLIFKRPGAKGYALHQDFISWPGFPESFLTVIVPIDATHQGNGATEVFPGLHRQGYLSARDADYHELPADSVAAAPGVFLDLQPGDLAVFGGFTPHRSAPNASDHWRRQLYLSYNAARDGGEQRDEHYRQFQVWLRKKYAEYGKTNVHFR